MPSSLATAGSSIAGGILGSNAAGDAAKAAQNAAQQSNQVSSNVWNQNQSNLNPFIGAGQNANSALSGLLGIGGNPAASQSAFNNYLNSTNYQFQLGQGLQGVQYANAPSFNSGGTAKALNNYAQGMAGSALSGYEGLLQGQASQGASSASALGALGTQYAGQQSQNNMAAAGATGSADLAGANSLTSMLSALSRGTGSGQSQSSFGSSPLSSIANGASSAIGSIFG